MIIGIGTDIIEIERISKVIENTNFLKRFFSEKENKLFLKKNFASETIAGNFSVKEAFSKAIGTGFRDLLLQDISVLRNPLGCPYIELSGELLEKFGKYKIHTSISHSQKYAIGYVIIEE